MSKSRAESTIGDLPDLDRIVHGGNDNRPAAPAAAPLPQNAEPTVVMTTRVPASLHRRLKVHLAGTRESGQDFAIRALLQLLEAETMND